jgi:hypothetical protein
MSERERERERADERAMGLRRQIKRRIWMSWSRDLQFGAKVVGRQRRARFGLDWTMPEIGQTTKKSWETKNQKWNVIWACSI